MQSLVLGKACLLGHPQHPKTREKGHLWTEPKPRFGLQSESQTLLAHTLFIPALLASGQQQHLPLPPVAVHPLQLSSYRCYPLPSAAAPPGLLCPLSPSCVICSSVTTHSPHADGSQPARCDLTPWESGAAAIPDAPCVS